MAFDKEDQLPKELEKYWAAEEESIFLLFGVLGQKTLIGAFRSMDDALSYIHSNDPVCAELVEDDPDGIWCEVTTIEKWKIGNKEPPMILYHGCVRKTQEYLKQRKITEILNQFGKPIKIVGA